MIEMMYPVVPLDAVIRGTVVATDMIEWAVLVVDTGTHRLYCLFYISLSFLNLVKFWLWLKSCRIFSEVMVLQAMVDHRHLQATHLPTSLTYIQAVDM